jgi:hypothetical protein
VLAKHLYGIAAVLAASTAASPSVAQQCTASAATKASISEPQVTAAVTLNVAGCRLSQGRFVLVTQLESMNGAVEFSERTQDWKFDGSEVGYFTYVVDHPRQSAPTDTWVKRDIHCTCAE